MSKFSKYAWSVLVVNIMVILWGAYVRASGSGAGCGSHWPLCNGVVIPLSPRIETIIEFIHRLTSGLAFVMVLGLFIFSRKNPITNNLVRRGASWSLFFIIIESLIGAGLVLLELVAKNESLNRVIFISIHLVNTFLLLASLTLTAWWASGGKPIRLKGKSGLEIFLAIGFLGVILLGISGAITALGDTLFPVESLQVGIQQDFSSTAHFLIRLRIWHPIIALSIGFYLGFTVILMAVFSNDRSIRITAGVLVGLFIVQLFMGLVNLLLLAPIPIQIVHLFMADMVWVVLVIFAASVLKSQQTDMV